MACQLFSPPRPILHPFVRSSSSVSSLLTSCSFFFYFAPFGLPSPRGGAENENSFAQFFFFSRLLSTRTYLFFALLTFEVTTCIWRHFWHRFPEHKLTHEGQLLFFCGKSCVMLMPAYARNRSFFVPPDRSPSIIASPGEEKDARLKDD